MGRQNTPFRYKFKTLCFSLLHKFKVSSRTKGHKNLKHWKEKLLQTRDMYTDLIIYTNTRWNPEIFHLNEIWKMNKICILILKLEKIIHINFKVWNNFLVNFQYLKLVFWSFSRLENVFYILFKAWNLIFIQFQNFELLI